MAKVIVYSNCDEVTCPDDQDGYCVFHGLKDGPVDTGTLVIKITVTSSTNGIKFSTIGNASLSNYTLTQDSSTYLTMGLAERQLYFCADAADDTFRVEF